MKAVRPLVCQTGGDGRTLEPAPALLQESTRQTDMYLTCDVEPHGYLKFYVHLGAQRCSL